MKKTLPALAALTLLAACSSDEPAPPQTGNGVEMLDVTNEALSVPEAPVTMNVPEPAAVNASTEEDAPSVDEREQIEADADARVAPPASIATTSRRPPRPTRADRRRKKSRRSAYRSAKIGADRNRPAARS